MAENREAGKAAGNRQRRLIKSRFEDPELVDHDQPGRIGGDLGDRDGGDDG
jgi:hypothetical protein